jgi:hypothetical protein
MTILSDLEPGDVVEMGVSMFHRSTSWVFVSRALHPFYPKLQLVTWVTSDGSELTMDALDPVTVVGLKVGHVNLRPLIQGRTWRPSNA